MKKRIRIITVNRQKFAWWYLIGEHETVVKVSPLDDKTSVVRVVFADIKESLYGQYNESVVLSISWVAVCQIALYEYNESIVISENDTEACVKIIEPRMAGLILNYFTKQNYIFETRKHITLNGYDLLSQMGYRIVEVKKGLNW